MLNLVYTRHEKSAEKFSALSRASYLVAAAASTAVKGGGGSAIVFLARAAVEDPDQDYSE